MTHCYGCADEFGFWKRNVGCPKCGFAYCQKCIRFKLNVGDSEGDSSNTQVVCQKCYLGSQPVTSNETTDGQKSVTASKAMEVLESMDNPAKPPITLYRESNRVAELKRGLSIEDQKIVDRLEELRGSGGRRRKSEPIEEEVAERLARLKGQPYVPSSGIDKSILLSPKAETEEDLISRLTNQVQIEKNYEDNAIDDIQQRLARLKGDDPSPTSSVPHGSSKPDLLEESKSEQEQVDQIIQKYLAEAALDEKAKTTTTAPKKDGDSDSEDAISIDESSEEEDEIDTDQLCKVCVEKRATIKCAECDDDIFCSKCFLEFHEEIGESHKPARVNFNVVEFK